MEESLICQRGLPKGGVSLLEIPQALALQRALPLEQLL
jgi:hypothetical protein